MRLDVASETRRRNATGVARLAARSIEVRNAVVKRQSYSDLHSMNPSSIYTMHIMRTDVPESNDEIYFSTAVSSHSQQLKDYKYYCLC